MAGNVETASRPTGSSDSLISALLDTIQPSKTLAGSRRVGVSPAQTVSMTGRRSRVPRYVLAAAAAALIAAAVTLRRVAVTDAGLAHLKKAASLTRIDLRETKVTSAGVQSLQAALPKCQIDASP